MTTDAENLEYALVTAAAAGNLYRVEHLLNVGAPVDSRGKREWTAFQMTNYDSNDIRELLLKRGADINARDVFGLTALHHEAQDDGAAEMLHWLLDRGAHVNAQDNEGDTALHAAVMSEQSKCCQVLIDRGADIESKNKKGLSPLAAAAETEFFEMCVLLIANGACTKDIESGSLMLATVLEMTPLDAAARLGGVALLKKLLEHDQNPASLCARVIHAMDEAKENGCVEAETLMRSWLAQSAARDALGEIQTPRKPAP